MTEGNETSRKQSSPFAYRSFVGRVLVEKGTGEAYRITGWVGNYQFIVKQDESDLEMFVPIKKLHKFVMLAPEDNLSGDELIGVETS